MTVPVYSYTIYHSPNAYLGTGAAAPRGPLSTRCADPSLAPLAGRGSGEGPLAPAITVDTGLPIARLSCVDHLGGCHCGNIHVRLRLSKPPEDNQLRACTCSFCRSHSPRMIADPEGLFEVWADDWSLVENYRFGTRTCDFLICRRCGVFIAAVSEMATGTRAVVNVNCLSDRGRFTSVPALHEFEGETVETRSSRRTANWMPAIIRR